jgi:hypothetical protein
VDDSRSSLLEQSAVSRGLEDTKKTLGTIWFWAVAIFGGGAVALIYGGLFGLTAIFSFFIAVLIVTICTAPVKQRNELRHQYRRLEEQLEDATEFVPRSEYESLKEELNHRRKYQPKVLSEKDQNRLVEGIRSLKLETVDIYMEDRSADDSRPLARQLQDIFKEAGCKLKDERLSETEAPVRRLETDIWLDAGKEVKSNLELALKSCGLSVTTRAEPEKEGRWAYIIVSVTMG